MGRGVMVVLAFAATVAQAQEAKNTAEETQRAGLPERERPAMLLASRLAPQPPADPLSHRSDYPDGKADTAPGTGEGNPRAPPTTGDVGASLANQVPVVARHASSLAMIPTASVRHLVYQAFHLAVFAPVQPAPVDICFG